ncbi:MAG: thiolase [Rhizobiaceae bacterium]|nr:thiolase [Rhizobiaceae bacterium]
MSDPFPRGRTAIVSTATHGIKGADGADAMELLSVAALTALKRAGLRPSDVDGLFCGLPLDFLSGLTVSEYLGVSPRMTNNNRTGGSSFMTHVMSAAFALDAGFCDVALVAYGSAQRSEAGKLQTPPKLDPIEGGYKLRYPIGSYALAAARHMHEFGTTREQFAEVAVAARGWANLNPQAFAQGPLEIADVLEARMVCDPLTVRDCCLVTDGAAALVMTRADRARDHTSAPVFVLGAGEATTHARISQMPDLTVSGAVQSGARAYAAAGVGPGDIDVVQLYDAFTFNTILFLEDLGFCGKGEGGPFIAGGRIAPGGSLPVNTNGGGLSCVHPGMYGLFGLAEAVDQLAGRCEEVRQIKDAEVALAHGNGGTLSSQATVILGTDATL